MAKILLAVDDKIFAEEMVNFLSRMPLPPEETQLRVLHAIEPVEAVAAWPSDQYRKEAEEMVVDMVDRLKDRFPKISISGDIVEGYAKEEIVDQAAAWQADLLIVGSHGRRGISRFLLGSVSKAVLAHAPCSVAVIRLARCGEHPAFVTEMEEPQAAGKSP